MIQVEMVVPPILACPVCDGPLYHMTRWFTCDNAHTFDMAKEGYINLLLAQHRHSKDPGYNKEMMAGRRDFFDAGHYEKLAENVADIIHTYLPNSPAVVLDAGCGEGYYLRRFHELLTARGDTRHIRRVGTDISKHAVRMAARRDPGGMYAVAGTFRLPFLPRSADVLLAHFSPVSVEDFRRVIRPGGVILIGGPGERHLHTMKELLYEKPTLHQPDDLLKDEKGFEALGTHTVQYPIHLEGPGQIANLLQMTPYNWSVTSEQRQQLNTMPTMDTTVDVQVKAYRRTTIET